MREVKQVRVGAAIGKGCVRSLLPLDSDFSFSAFQHFSFFPCATLGERLAPECVMRWSEWPQRMVWNHGVAFGVNTTFETLPFNCQVYPSFSIVVTSFAGS
jgi:hypothetical protein